MRCKHIPSVHALDPTVVHREYDLQSAASDGHRRGERLQLRPRPPGERAACPRWALAGEGTPAAALAPGRAAAAGSRDTSKPLLQPLAGALLSPQPC